ncbi:hypothetical protein HNQ57_002841 [Zhongshania antarctica]|uniref:Uncharacterized protein n=1 Tax=Zhongshania antarctica TaxID=641702 RepID=A0A840R880_9GAMM|nr:hypothetical protein [Zhongshania antarctica]MBB5188551.1 hypothetical protein [Zhongshania antarctica]
MSGEKVLKAWNRLRQRAATEESQFSQWLTEISPDLPMYFRYALAEYYGWCGQQQLGPYNHFGHAIKRLNRAAVELDSVWRDLFPESYNELEARYAWAFLTPLDSTDKLAQQQKRREEVELQYSSIAMTALNLYEQIEWADEDAAINGGYGYESNLLKLTEHGEPGPKFLLSLAASISPCEFLKHEPWTENHRQTKERETVIVVRPTKSNEALPIWSADGKNYSEIGEIYRLENWQHPKLKYSDGPPPKQRLLIIGKNDQRPPTYQVADIPKRGYEINYTKGRSPALNYIRQLRCELGPNIELKEWHCEKIILGVFEQDPIDMKIKELLQEPITHSED